MTAMPAPCPTDTAALRIAIADDHAGVRMGCRRLLEDEPDLHVVAEYADATAAWTDLCRRAPDDIQVLVLDLSMPGTGGLDLLRRLQIQRPGLRVLVFTMHDTASLRAQCLRAGAAGFLGKGGDPAELLHAIRTLPARPATAPTSPPPPPARSAPHDDLTPREHEALLLLLQGLPLDQVARTMGVSDKTVSNYQTSIRQKLDVGSAIELIRYGLQHGLMP
jgi:DNA-binding NarL/FixJ family response regulator